MVVVTVVAVVVIARLGFVAVVSYEADAKDPGDDRGDEADDGSDNGNDESKEGVGDQDRVRACLRRGYQEGHAGRTGRPLPAHLGNDRNDRATAQRHGYADGRTRDYGFQIVVAEPAENGLTGDGHMDQAGEEQPQQQHGRQQQEGGPEEVEKTGHYPKKFKGQSIASHASG